MARIFRTLSGVAAPLPVVNLDTDVIIRVARLAALPPEQLGDYALETLRFRPDGSRNPDCVLNQPPYDQASILVGDENFGCGSSREAAVWALQGLGIRCVIAPSFGGIFHTNCFENGVLPIVLPRGEIHALFGVLQETPDMTVDLERQEIRVANRVIAFSVDPLWRAMLMEGLDPIGMTLRQEAAIAKFQAGDRTRRPWMVQEGR